MELGWALRCCTGLSSSGSIRASRTSVRASSRSSLRRLLTIKRTFCACATITSCPSAVKSRLTQGECVPVSIAMRQCAILPKVCFIASGVVASFCSRRISPASFKTQYEPRTISQIQPNGELPLKNVFPTHPHSANLLHCRSPFYCAFEHVQHWERIASRGRPAFSFHLVSRITGNLDTGTGPLSPVKVVADNRPHCDDHGNDQPLCCYHFYAVTGSEFLLLSEEQRNATYGAKNWPDE